MSIALSIPLTGTGRVGFPAIMASAPVRRRVNLDRELILDTAMGLAATGGADAVSVRKLGTALGADPTAIYRHFRDMDELGDALLDRLYGRAAGQLDAAMPWRPRLERLARVLVGLLLEHPAIAVRASTTTTTGPHETDGIEIVLEGFAEAGLADDDLLQFYAFFVNYLLAFAASLAWHSVDRPDHGDPTQVPWVPQVFPVDATRHPLVARHADALTAMTHEQVLEGGLALILDAAEARAASR